VPYRMLGDCPSGVWSQSSSLPHHPYPIWSSNEDRGVSLCAASAAATERGEGRRILIIAARFLTGLSRPLASCSLASCSLASCSLASCLCFSSSGGLLRSLVEVGSPRLPLALGHTLASRGLTIGILRLGRGIAEGLGKASLLAGIYDPGKGMGGPGSPHA
jgi:hypothetical protein